MNSSVFIKDEIDQEMIEVKEEPVDDTRTIVNAAECPAQQAAMQFDDSQCEHLLLTVKEELLPENVLLSVATIAWEGETSQGTGDCIDSRVRMESSVSIKDEIHQGVTTVKEEPVDDRETIDNSADCQEALHQIDMQLDSIDNQLGTVKEELLTEDVSLAVSSTRTSSIAIKDETCLGEHSDDCIDADRNKKMTRNGSSSVLESGGHSDDKPSDCPESSDSEETIVDVPVTAPAVSVSGSLPANSKRSPPCPECGKTLWTSSALKVHMRVHADRRQYACTECPKTFKESWHLKKHQATHQTERSKPFLCTATGCERAFLSKDQLKVHLRRHTGERPFTCPECPKAFTRLSNFKQHQATHQTERRRPFLCTVEGCGKAFPTKPELTVHLRRHMGTKPYKCSSCGKGFPKSSDLTVHLRSHTGDTPFNCDICGKGFTTSSHLTRHHLTHTGERPYQCPLCPKAFTQLSTAKKHQQTVHQTES